MERKPKGYWTLERIEVEVKKYSSRVKLKKGNSTVYSYLSKRRILNNYYPHLSPYDDPNAIYNLEQITNI